MSGDIIRGNAWILSDAESANPTWTEDQAPKAGDVLHEFGLTLGIHRALALVANVCLCVTGVLSP